jgi:hypothetical protein
MLALTFKGVCTGPTLSRSTILFIRIEERRFTLDHQGIEPRVPNRRAWVDSLLILKLNYVKNEYELDKKDKEENEGH